MHFFNEETMIIKPAQIAMTYRTGTIKNYTYNQIVEILGFAPNVNDDPKKVVNSWAFTVDGFEAAIWDYDNSHFVGCWSIYDPHNVLGHLFVVENI